MKPTTAAVDEKNRAVMIGAGLSACIMLLAILLPLVTRHGGNDEGAGELVVVRGGTTAATQNGTRLFAPIYPNAGQPIPAEGTVKAPLVWIEDLCETALNCDALPLQINHSFDASSLNGTVLVYAMNDPRMFMSGFNRAGRAFGGTGLVALARAFQTTNSLVLPGAVRKAWRVGEHRDAIPHDGDFGIPFPHVVLREVALTPVLEAVANNERIEVVIYASEPNHFMQAFYGFWLVIRAPFIVGHLAIVEYAFCFLKEHISESGPRPDLAQMALIAEIVAHLWFPLWLTDPHLSFYWGWFPQGASAAFLIGGTVLTCSSTLLLAAYWHQMISNNGLASVSVKGARSCVLSGLATLMGMASGWLVVTEASVTLVYVYR